MFVVGIPMVPRDVHTFILEPVKMLLSMAEGTLQFKVLIKGTDLEMGKLPWIIQCSHMGP